MKASLASATSLLALLIGREAVANPVITVAGTESFGYVLVTQPNQSVTVTDIATISGLSTSTTPGTGSISAGSGYFSGGGISGAIPSTSGTVTETATFTFAPAATGTTTNLITGKYTWSGGSVSTTQTLTGTGVAPVANGPVTAVNAGYVLVGQSSAVTLNVSNTGNAYLAESNRATNSATYNLNGSITGGNSVFVGTAASISLQDSNYTGTGAQTSASYAYTFKPTVVGAASTAVTTTFTNGIGVTNGGGSVTSVLSGTGVAPVQSVAPTSTTYVRVGTTGTASVVVGNIGNGNLAGTGTAFNLNGSVTNALGTGFAIASGNSGTISLASNATSTTGSTATSTLGYTYTPTARGAAVTSTVTLGFTNGNSNGTNLSQSVAATLTGVGVGPVYASATSILGGSATTNTPAVKGTLGAVGPAGATISFGTLGYKQSDTIYLELQNTTTDSAAAALLTDLTIDKYTITGTNASSVSVSSLSNSPVITEGGMLLVPITVVGTAGAGVLNSSLTIFTDESAVMGMGGSGDTFTYALTAIDVPEPASLAVLGAGLAGLASFRRRRPQTRH